MKVWFDLSNSPHINLFLPIIKELEKKHEIVVTCRPLANTVELLDLVGLEYTIVGKHYGKNIVAKMMGYPIRIWQLFSFLRNKKIDIAISQSSFHSPVVSWLLNVPSIYMNDNEHAKGNIPSFLFATRILVPEFLTIDMLKQQYANPQKVIQYPGVKEGIYLSAMNFERETKQDGKPKIYLRPEPWVAQYYKGEINFLDPLLLELQHEFTIVLLPRGKEQAEHYLDDAFSNITVQDIPLTLEEIVYDCDLFIGAGGTMTREIAILGIPTISVYQDDLLKVDEFLIDNKLMQHIPLLTAKEVRENVAKEERKDADMTLLNKGVEARNIIIQELTALYAK